MHVTGLWLHPVKSLGGQPLDEAEVGLHGLVGDRHWGILDGDTGLTLTGRREGRLLTATAQLDGDSPLIRLPDGRELRGTGPDTDRALSEWLDRSVTLEPARSGAAARYETTLEIDESGDWVEWEGPTGSFHDSTRTMVSLASQASMGAWDQRRFRINVVLDGDLADELALVGTSIALGSCRLDVVKRVDRCVMVTRPQPDGVERDLDVLRTINREHEGFLGVGALVTATGTVRVGDRLAG